jgi:hypothetical protein
MRKSNLFFIFHLFFLGLAIAANIYEEDELESIITTWGCLVIASIYFVGFGIMDYVEKRND